MNRSDRACGEWKLDGGEKSGSFLLTSAVPQFFPTIVVRSAHALNGLAAQRTRTLQQPLS